MLFNGVCGINRSMLNKKETSSRNQIRMVSIEDLVPQDHILQKIEKAIDFGFMYEEVKDLQSGHRQTEYRPGMLSKAVHHKLSVRIQQYVPDDQRMRSEYGVRWFIGYDITEKEPHFSTFGKNYMHRFAGTDLFERISIRVLEEAISQGFVIHGWCL